MALSPKQQEELKEKHIKIIKDAYKIRDEEWLAWSDIAPRVWISTTQLERIKRRYPRDEASIEIKNAWFDAEDWDLTHAWKTPKGISAFVKKKAVVIDYVKVINDVLASYEFEKVEIKKTTQSNQIALKATISDAHIWLDPNPKGNWLFQYEYNQELYKKNMQGVYKNILKEHATYWDFDFIIVQDLWDALDGYNSETTRWWHKLDQNMTEEEVFSTYIWSNVNIIENILQSWITKKLIMRYIGNDNHSGKFGRMAHMTIEGVINKIYGKWTVEFQLCTRFMQHFTYWDHCFIVTHGRDEKHCKSWLPYRLTPQAINFIHQYISHYKIDSKYIHIEKWDLHQIGFEKTKEFDYRNYMSFAPWSAWVAHNFGDSYSGYSISVIPKKTNEISHTDYFLDYKVK